MLENVDCNLSAPDLYSMINGPIKDLHEQLTTNIMKQMEFYFGDPNLLRDRNLYMEMNKSKKGYINLSYFLTSSTLNSFFQAAHITSIPQKLAYLIQAVNRSKLLRISKHEKIVKRVVPFDHKKVKSRLVKDEQNKRMIYVEKLPEFITAQILAQFFQKFGQILYIELPNYPKTKNSPPKIRGFAFIEFKVRFLFQLQSYNAQIEIFLTSFRVKNQSRKLQL